MYISNASKLKIGGFLSNGQAQKVCFALRNKKGITSMLDITQIIWSFNKLPTNLPICFIIKLNEF